MTSATGDSPLDIVLSTALFVSFGLFCFLLATLRSHVDEKKVREEPSVVRAMTLSVPPEHLLTPAGKRRVKMAKLSLIFTVVCVAVIVVRKQIL